MKKLLSLLLSTILLSYSSSAFAAEYSFTKIYAGATQPAVAINDNGLAAFCTNTSLLTTDGQTTTVIAGPNGPNKFYDFYTPQNSPQLCSINNNGFVTFHGAIGGRAALLASNGSATTTIAAEYPLGSFNNMPTIGAATINDGGAVAFWGAKYNTNDIGIYYGNGGTPVWIPSTQPNGTVGPAINNSGAIAFWSQYTYSIDIWTNTHEYSFRLPDSTMGSRPDINDAGVAAFLIGRYSSTGHEDKIAIWDGISEAAYIDGGNFWRCGSGNQFDLFGEATCDINNQGLVAFYAYLTPVTTISDTFTGGIYTGPDPLSDKVIAAGDALGGLTVSKVTFYRGGLNNLGQIAFTATLSDGTKGVWVATPVPEPSSLILLGIAAFGCAAYALRHRNW